MTGPRSTGEGPRGGDRRSSSSGVPRVRTSEFAAVGGAERRPTSGERRSSGAERQRPPAPVPWAERNGTALRIATWIGVALIAIRLAAPRPDGYRRWNDASEALQDVEAARTAALIYFQASSHQWPQPGRFGQSPQGMLPYLPGGVSFGRPRYRMAWEYAADSTSGAHVIGISVIGDDPRLARSMAQRAPAGMPFIVSAERFTVLIATGTGR